MPTVVYTTTMKTLIKEIKEIAKKHNLELSVDVTIDFTKPVKVKWLFFNWIQQERIAKLSKRTELVIWDSQYIPLAKKLAVDLQDYYKEGEMQIKVMI